MELDTRLRQGEVITDRERFLLGVISYLDEQDCWYLDEAPGFLDRLREDFGWTGGRKGGRDAPGSRQR